MKPSSFRSLSMSRFPGERQNKRRQEESMWNVFVQILLPIVLVVTFIAVLDIVRYKDVAEKSTSLLLDIWSQDHQKSFFQKQQLIINLQRQKLINALQEIRIREEKGFRLVKFLQGGNSVALDGATIADDDFRHLCEVVKRRVVDNEPSYLKEVYGHVLISSSISDPRLNQYRIKKRSEDGAGGSQEQVYKANEQEISDQNRLYIHNRIIEYVYGIKEAVVNIQNQVLIRLYNELLKKPEDLDKRSSELVHCILYEPDKVRKDECAESFYQRMMGHVRIKVKSYPFLDQTWNQVSKLNIDERDIQKKR